MFCPVDHIYKSGGADRLSWRILSPAGSKEGLKAAIKGGADAVYIGGKMFGARRSAANFSDSELKAAVELAHRFRNKERI